MCNLTRETSWPEYTRLLKNTVGYVRSAQALEKQLQLKGTAREVLKKIELLYNLDLTNN